MIDIDPDRYVTEVVVYRGGTVEVKRSGAVGVKRPDMGVGVKGNVSYLSAKSRSRLMFIVSATSAEFGSMITLTYPGLYPTSGQQVKHHLRRMLQYLNRQYGKDYLWFLEFQSRGAPHLHVLYCMDVVSMDDRKWLAVAWCRAIGIDTDGVYLGLRGDDRRSESRKVMDVHRHRRAWEKVKSKDGASRYVSKYAFKTYQKEVPREFSDCGRFWGHSKGVGDVQEVDRVHMNADQVRELLRSEGHRVYKWDVLPKYILGVQSLNI
jgi:hypothetical protein